MALGKGLGALIAPSNNRRFIKKGQLSNGLDSEKVWQIPLESIQPNPNQPRRHFSPKELDGLAVSIKEHGVLQPVLVDERADGGYELISGERRYRASKIAGLSQIPALVKKMADQQKLEVSLIENIQREELTPLEEAFAYNRLVNEFGLTQQEVADKVGKARSTVANVIRMLELPDEVKEALNEGKINMSQARALLGLKDKQEQLEMLSSMLGQKILVKDLERAVSRKSMGRKIPAKRRDPNLVYLEDQLRDKLSTKVTITERNNKGRILIEFYSKEELSALVDKLNS